VSCRSFCRGSIDSRSEGRLSNHATRSPGPENLVVAGQNGSLVGLRCVVASAIGRVTARQVTRTGGPGPLLAAIRALLRPRADALLGVREVQLAGPCQLRQPLQVAGCCLFAVDRCAICEVRASAVRRVRVEPRAQRVLGLDLCCDPRHVRVVKHADGDHGQVVAGVVVDLRWDSHGMFLGHGRLVDRSVGALRIRSNHGSRSHADWASS